MAFNCTGFARFGATGGCLLRSSRSRSVRCTWQMQSTHGEGASVNARSIRRTPVFLRRSVHDPRRRGGMRSSASTSAAPNHPPPPSRGNRVSELFRKYGKVAIGVHLVVYTTFLAGCYVAVDQKLDVKGALARVGLLSSKPIDESGGSAESWLDKIMSGGSSTLALAFICNKALFPVRTPITLALTPVVARFLRRRNLLKT